jgi:peptide/nickel transport system substrate-binding protein
MSRTILGRPALALTLTAAALTTGLAACGSDSSTDTASAAGGGGGGKPVSGGTLKFAINSDTDCLDPHQSPADVAGFFSRPILDSLVALNADGTIKPWLATKWSVSDDGLTYSFTLRDDVTFSNGEKFDGAAVKANLDHIVDPKTKSKLAAGTIATYAGTTVVDPTHVEIKFKSPNSAFLPTLATAYLGIEAPSTLKQAPDALCKKIVGSGPFTSDAGYTPQKGIDFVRNDAYNWGPGNAKHSGKAYLAGIDVTVVPEDSSRYGALTSGQLDAIASVPPVDVKALKANASFKVQTAPAPGGNYAFYPNQTDGPFKDIRVRQAFRSGIDFATIVKKLYFGVFAPAEGPLGNATVGYDPQSASAYAYDQAKANQLLDEAGWSKKNAQGIRVNAAGQELTLVHPYLKQYTREQRDVLADQIQAAAKEIGIDIVNKNVTIDQYYGFVGSGKGYDLADFSWQRASPDALRTLFGSENIATPKTGFGTNIGRFSNKEVDGLFKTALDQTDLAEQKATYAKAQQIIADNAAAFPLYQFSYVLGESAKVQGVAFEPQAFPTFYDAWLGA